VQVILFFFGLVNAGVMPARLRNRHMGAPDRRLVGRPIGALAGVAVATAAGLHLPSRVEWRDLAVVALATSSGFTLALFVAVSILAPGSVLSELKIGALSIVIGALLAFGAAAALHVGRFAHRHPRPA
jgi:Na+/H+ antiporter NhaA